MAWVALAVMTTTTLLAALSGCDGDESAAGEPDGVEQVSGQTTTMQFNVDPALLGETQRFAAFGVQFAPPAGWDRLPEEQMAAVAAAVGAPAGPVAADNVHSTGTTATTPTTTPAAMPPSGVAAAGGDDEFQAEPVAVFSQPGQGVWLLVSALNIDEPQRYTAMLRRQPEQVLATEFQLHGIAVHQYLIRPDGLVNFKLLLNAPGRADSRRLQLDFVVAQTSWAKAVRAVESSIGSVRPTSGNQAAAATAATGVPGARGARGADDS